MLLRCLRLWLIGIMTLLVGCAGQSELPATVTVPTPIATSTIVTPATATPLLPTVTAVVAVEQPPLIAGAWLGGFQLPDGSPQEQKISLRFTESDGQLQGAITNPFTGADDQLDSITSTTEKLQFEWRPAAGQAVRFEGVVSGYTMTGTVKRGASSGDFGFVRSAEQSESAYLEFAGAYRFETGDGIGFYETNDPQAQVFATRLVYADLQTGSLAAAFPISDTSVAIGSAVGLAYPFAGEVTFVHDDQGAVSGLTLNRPGMPEMVATRVAFGVEEVRFPAGDADIAGRLVVPETPGKHSAVVLVHGAGRLTRRNWLYDMLSDWFALRGIATLSHDKRGVGDSGGRFVDSASETNLQVLAQDALAGVTYLKSRADVDATRIGMQGSSQAGWIIPLAAGQSDDVAFMLIWSGPAVTQGITDLYDHSAESTDRERLTQILRDTRPFGFDPLPSLAMTDAPGFWAFGGLDMTVPVPESIAKLEQVTAAGQKDFTWQVFPTGDHYMWDGPTTTERELRFSRGLVPGLLEQMQSWLLQHSFTK